MEISLKTALIILVLGFKVENLNLKIISDQTKRDKSL